MKIICVGRNYAAHARELNNPVAEKPVIFMKPESALLTGRHPFFIPDFSNNIHYEIELVVKINRLGKNIQPRFARRYYDEIGLGIDFTARDLQLELKSKGLPWELAKGFDGSAAVGAFLPKPDDTRNIAFGLKKNQAWVQQGNSSEMLFPIDELISFVSHYFTLKNGDLIFTGTPAGVGRVDKGDLLEGYIGDKKMITVKVR